MTERPLRILVLGFSVTAEIDGYVEVATGRGNAVFAATEIVKVGLGGFHPTHVAPLLDFIIEEKQPDAVVLEIATSSFRSFTNAAESHRQAFAATLQVCHLRALPCAVLDLPRTDVDYGNDFATAMQEQTCAGFGLPYRRVDPAPGMFKDVVHPTAAGREIMADALIGLVADLLAGPRNVPPAQPVVPRSCLPLTQFMAPGSGRPFARSGLQLRCLVLHPSRPFKVRLPEPKAVSGMLVLAGPKSGRLRITFGDGSRREVEPYDAFCYYERMYPITFPPVVTNLISLEQLSGVPGIPLHKGEKDNGPRVGHVGLLFVTEPPSGANTAP